MQTIDTPSFWKIIFAKILLHIHSHKLTQLIKQCVGLIIGIFIGAAIVVPEITFEALKWMATTRSYAFPKLAMVFTLFFYRKNLMRFFRRLTRKSPVIRQEKLIDNIPVSELTDYLIRNKHFKREGVNGVRATFGLNMEKFNRLANKLEENGVLTRGENNGRFLSERWTRQTLIDFLSQTEKSETMVPWLRIHKIGGKVRLEKQELMT